MQPFNHQNMNEVKAERLRSKTDEQENELARMSHELAIENSLKRIWLQAMAMQNSAEFNVLIQTIYAELKALDASLDRCFIMIFDVQTKGVTWWMTGSDGALMQDGYWVPYSEHPPQMAYLMAWQERNAKWQYLLEGPEKKDWDQFLFSETELSGLPDFVIQHMEAVDKVYLSGSFRQFGCLTTGSFQPLSEGSFDILIRFAHIFDLTYTRFNDLRKAEAQAREAQIELGLERVRAKAMAMHHSDELKELVKTLFIELTRLNINLHRCMIWIGDPVTFNARVWILNPETMEGQSLTLPYNEDPFYQDLLTGWKERNPNWNYTVDGERYKNWLKFLLNDTDFSHLPEVAKAEMRALEKVVFWAANYNYGAIQVAARESFSEDQLTVLRRFSKVFDMSYTRFLDLQKAEAQAREAQIEAALERVRSRTMGMQKSEELREVIQLIMDQLCGLHFRIDSASFTIELNESNDVRVWLAAPGQQYAAKIYLPYIDHPLFNRLCEAKEKSEHFFTLTCQKEEKDKFFDHFIKYVPGISVERRNFFYSGAGWSQSSALMKTVGLSIQNYSGIPYSEDQNKTLVRFGKAFEQSYTRFLDLQKAEASANVAIRQASLDRVRAEIASMRTTSDLQRIIPIIWNELTTLGVSFIRCGVFIMDEEQQLIQTFLSTPEGKAIAAFNMAYHAQGKIAQVLHHWQQKEIFIDYWDVTAFTEFAEGLVKQGALTSSEQYLNTLPGNGFFLHFMPFRQGMLYVGNTTQLGEENINIAQTLADAFSTAYARYEDFNKLEAAKQQVEAAFAELRSTQAQLIQKEKMASLGELTAGIAHEIQNPLNFVNNFSFGNKELIAEMKQELRKGNYEEALTIADDIEKNEEKIVHHGQRADSIVKGMLQHSRIGTGQKEQTDINRLIDEHLQLSYHAVRAKDKSFNAKLQTNYDQRIGRIYVVPQNIGRVLINLFNNAFYAVCKKKQQLNGTYEPIVSVSTKTENGKVEITVKDNGNGIPQKVRDKIFQPFFTTKPTGEGTGLGLSLSYDIISKGHGGELLVETEEGQGAAFIIRLPAER